MKSVNAEGISFIYFTKHDSLVDKILSEGKAVNADFVKNFWNQIKADGLLDIRFVVYEYPFSPGRKQIRFLHWSDRTDLTLLDTKVEENTYIDDDFRKSVVTFFSTTKCLVCGWQGYALEMDFADVYVGIQELEKRKIREHQFDDRCPKCGTGLTRLVVKIFDWSIDSST